MFIGLFNIKFRNFPQVVCPLTMCDFEPQLIVCVSTFPQKNLTSSFEPLVLSGRDVSEDLLDKSLSILWKLGTLVIPTITKKKLKIKLTKYLQWRGEIKPNSLPIEMYYNVLNVHKQSFLNSLTVRAKGAK